MRYGSILAGFLAVAGVNSGATGHIEDGNGEIVERLRGVPEGWSEIGTPAQDHKLHFRIAVRSVGFLAAFRMRFHSLIQPGKS
jgi:tripeptidyl-peptidase-1